MIIYEGERETRRREPWFSPYDYANFKNPIAGNEISLVNQESGSRHKEKVQNMDYRVVTEMLVNCEHNVCKHKMEEATTWDCC